MECIIQTETTIFILIWSVLNDAASHEVFTILGYELLRLNEVAGLWAVVHRFAEVRSSAIDSTLEIIPQSLWSCNRFGFFPASPSRRFTPTSTTAAGSILPLPNGLFGGPNAVWERKSETLTLANA